jgi:hypothetical protein
MTPKAFRTKALSFEGTYEVPHFDRAAFRTKKRIFATMSADGTEVMIKVASQSRIQELLATQPDVFLAYGGFTTKMGALGVRLAKVDTKLLLELLTAAYEASVVREKGPPRARRATLAKVKSRPKPRA